MIFDTTPVDPSAVVEAFGVNGVAVMSLGTLAATTVVEAAAIGGTTPPTLPTIPAGYVIVAHGDGTVTLTGSDQS
jgi:hypothetical protein